MNKDSFFTYIENTRDCEPARLDMAVARGLRKAKSGTLDSRKFLMLAAACVFTVLMCFSVNLRPFTSAFESYYRSWNETMPGSGEVLEGYLKDITCNIKRHLGGK